MEITKTLTAASSTRSTALERAFGAAELLREQTAVTLKGIQDGGMLIKLFLVHTAIGLIRQ